MVHFSIAMLVYCRVTAAGHQNCSPIWVSSLDLKLVPLLHGCRQGCRCLSWQRADDGLYSCIHINGYRYTFVNIDEYI